MPIYENNSRRRDKLYSGDETYEDKNSSVDEIANMNFYAVRPEAT